MDNELSNIICNLLDQIIQSLLVKHKPLRNGFLTALQCLGTKICISIEIYFRIFFQNKYNII